MASRHLFSIALAAVILIAASSLLAQEPIQVNYQGKLTNSSGLPLTGTYSLTFALYNGSAPGTTPAWSETQSVIVTNGLFNVLLGAVSPLYDTTFKSAEQWLGVKVGADPELTPRTRLAALPAASFAYRVLGTVQTGEGELQVQTVAGDTAITAGTHGDSSWVDLSWIDEEKSAVGLRRPGLNLSSASGGASLKVFNQNAAYRGEPAFEINASPAGNVSWRIFAPQPEPPRVLISAEGDLAGSGWVRMFAPQPEPPKEWLRLGCEAGSGPSMSFFDNAGQVMGVGPSPFGSRIAMNLMDPNGGSPLSLAQMEVTYGTRASAAALSMATKAVDGTAQKLCKMTADAAGGELRLGPGQEGGTISYISALSSATSGSITLVGPLGVGFPPPPPSKISLRVNGDARIGIGTDAPTQALHVVGNICYTGTIGACSDEKFKKDIETIEGALPMVEQLDGVRYSWRTDEYPDQQFSDERQVGFVAQDVQQVLPEAVTTQDDGSLTVDYSRITPLLVQAIKELKAENEALKKRLEKLEKK